MTRSDFSYYQERKDDEDEKDSLLLFIMIFCPVIIIGCSSDKEVPETEEGFTIKELAEPPSIGVLGKELDYKSLRSRDLAAAERTEVKNHILQWLEN